MSGKAQVLARFMTAQIGPHTLIRQDQTHWASATFSGARHRYECCVPATVDVSRLVRDLPDAEIPLPSGFVADALVTSVTSVADEQHIIVEFLTINAD